MISRSPTIDLMRFIGLTLIVLAHISPPETIFQIRTFDVPLMIFISGMAYSGRRPDFSPSFFIKRLKRLVLPVYIFLTVYFAAVFIIKALTGFDFGIQRHHIIGSYLLQDGIGFVWIIRVFLMIALMTPVFILIDKLIRHTFLTGILCLLLGLLIELAVNADIGMNNLFIRDFVYYAIGYGAVFLIGLKIGKYDIKTLKKDGTILLAIFIPAFIICGLTLNSGGNWLIFNNFKYPPRIYFILYGVIASICIYLSLARLSRIPDILLFIGSNTIWIYLYHIPLVQFTGMLSINWPIRYIIVYCGAIAMTAIQTYAVHYIESKSPKIKPYTKYLVG